MKKLITVALALLSVASYAQRPLESGTVRTALTYHILVKTEAEAQTLFAEITSSPQADRLARFRDIAKRASADPSSRPSGGNLGKVFEGEMVKSFENAIFASTINRVTGPFRSEFGWHLTYVTEFGSESVADICRPPLASAYSDATGRTKAGLELAMQPVDRSSLPAKVLALIGQGWSSPLAGENGNLVFMRLGSKGDKSVVQVTQHIEAIDGELEVTARPKGCARSAQNEWAIKCATNQFAFISSATFEGRGAVGRVLKVNSVGMPEATFRPIPTGSFAKQMHALACKPNM
jgi:PPIC-type PPIASE domain